MITVASSTLPLSLSVETSVAGMGNTDASNGMAVSAITGGAFTIDTARFVPRALPSYNSVPYVPSWPPKNSLSPDPSDSLYNKDY